MMRFEARWCARHSYIELPQRRRCFPSLSRPLRQKVRRHRSQRHERAAHGERQHKKEARPAAPDMPVLIVTGTEDDALLLDLLDRGVAGFAPKTASTRLSKRIVAGGRCLPARLAQITASRIDTGGVIASATVRQRLLNA